MRVAAIYDIHGNLPALDAVLHEVRRSGGDLVVVGGDVVPGPMPRETLARLRELDIPVECIRGNGEREVLACMAGAGAAALPGRAREILRWTAEQLRPEDERMIASWPQTLRLDVAGVGATLFCHATPRSDSEIFTRSTPEDRLAPIFAGLNVDLVVCGHTHMPFDRTAGGVRILNAGSAGMPFGEPGADWLLLGPDVRPRHTAYDLERAAERIRRTSHPEAGELADGNVLHPPSAQAMLEAFSRAEPR